MEFKQSPSRLHKTDLSCTEAERGVSTLHFLQQVRWLNHRIELVHLPPSSRLQKCTRKRTFCQGRRRCLLCVSYRKRGDSHWSNHHHIKVSRRRNIFGGSGRYGHRRSAKVGFLAYNPQHASVAMTSLESHASSLRAFNRGAASLPLPPSHLWALIWADRKGIKSAQHTSEAS